MSRKIFIAAFLFFTCCGLSGYAQQKYLSGNDLPTAIQTYISNHFSKNKIVKTKQKRKPEGTTYKVTLDPYVKLEFDKQNQIKEIKSKTPLPDAVLPASIIAYVKAQYPGHAILKWEKESTKQEIKLDNKIELEFDLNGTFLRID